MTHISLRRQKVLSSVVRWIIYTITFSICALLFGYFATHAVGQGLDWNTFMARGEVSMVSATICFAAYGELASTGTGRTPDLSRIAIQGLNALVGFLATLLFAFGLTSQVQDSPTNDSLVAFIVLVVLVASVVSSTTCVAIASGPATQGQEHDDARQ